MTYYLVFLCPPHLLVWGRIVVTGILEALRCQDLTLNLKFLWVRWIFFLQVTALPPSPWGNFLLKTNNPLDSMTTIGYQGQCQCPSQSHERNILSATPGGKLITSGTKDRRMTYLPRILWPVCPGLHWGRCSDSSAHNHASRWYLHSNITWFHAGQCQRHTNTHVLRQAKPLTFSAQSILRWLDTESYVPALNRCTQRNIIIT